MIALNHLPTPVATILERYWQRLLEKEEAQPDSPKLSALVTAEPGFAQQLVRVWSASDYAATLCVQNPALLIDLKTSGELERAGKDDFHAELAARLVQLQDVAPAEQDATLKRVLRQYQQRQMLRIVWRDVCVLADVKEICADISSLADAQLDNALHVLHAWGVRQWHAAAHGGDRHGQAGRT